MTTTAQAATPDDMRYPAASVAYEKSTSAAGGVQYTHVNGINNDGG